MLARQNHVDPSDGWQEQLQADVVREIAQGDRNAFEMIRVQLEHLLNSGSLLVVNEASTASPIPPEPNREKQEKTKAVSQPALKNSLQQQSSEDPARQQIPEKDSAHPIYAAADSQPPEADFFDEGSSARHARQLEKKPLFKAGTLQAAHFAHEQKAMDPDTIDQMRKEIFSHAVELAELVIATAWFHHVKDQDNPTPADYLKVHQASNAPIRQIWAMHKPQGHGVPP